MMFLLFVDQLPNTVNHAGKRGGGVFLLFGGTQQHEDGLSVFP